MLEVTCAEVYSSNILRYSLTEIEPFEVSEIVRKANLKFRVIERGFKRPLASSKKLEDLIADKYYSIFQTIKVPEDINIDAIIEKISRTSIETLEKDKEIKEAIEEIEKTRDSSKPLLNFIRLFKERYESRLDQKMKVYAVMFLNSNFPLSFFSKLASFENVLIDFINIMEGIVRSYEFQATAARSFQMFKRKVKEMQKKLIPLIDELDLCDLAYSRLLWYILLWNLKNDGEKIHIDFLDQKRLDPSELWDLSKAYDEQIKSSRRLLWQYCKQQPISTLYEKEITLKGSAKNLFANLLVLSSLNI